MSAFVPHRVKMIAATAASPFFAFGLALLAMAGAPASAADAVPTFNVTPSCRTGVDQGIRKDIQSCIDSENNSRALLVRQWDEFDAADRALCTKASSMGGSPTYTELITCLEMRRDVKKLDQRAEVPATPRPAERLTRRDRQ
jgi:hypothetical protein